MHTAGYTLSAAIFFSALIFSGCKDKERPGCKDLAATNFCSDCNEEANGLCQYTGNVVFWYQYGVADSLQTLGVTSLSYYISGQLAGTSPLYHMFWMPDPWFGIEGPYCGEDSAVTFSRNWETQRNPSFNYSIKDQNGSERFSGNVTFNAGQCVKVQIEF